VLTPLDFVPYPTSYTVGDYKGFPTEIIQWFEIPPFSSFTRITRGNVGSSRTARKRIGETALAGFSVGAFGVKHFRRSSVDRSLRMSLAGATLLFGIGAVGPPRMESGGCGGPIWAAC
jgi:hypothetical protein